MSFPGTLIMSFPSNSIVPQMVSQLTIVENCLEFCEPCTHQCIITLTDGRKKTVSVSNPEIHSLIQDIALQNIQSPWEAGHFKNSGTPTPAKDILTRIFKA